ncbi:MAG: RDD family protein [Candidatus Aminicenantes bacterium]|nr:RDD family protein [Acidobacteriota bacterium]MCG2812930.1 RDD family protein [Candidatus Aminicenantes bacterium]
MKKFPRNKSRPDQAGFFRRFFAFAFDFVLILVLSIFIIIVYFEIKASQSGAAGPISHLKQNWGKKGSQVIIFASHEARERGLKRLYLEDLQGKLSKREQQHAASLPAEEIRREYGRLLSREAQRALMINAGKKLHLLQEIILGYLYFIFSFRCGGRTLGKRLFRLQVVDLDGKERLSWYQSFERAHGYAASSLSVMLGFLQVLWDHTGLTMHDKIAHTTVIRLPKKEKKSIKKPKNRPADKENSE